MGLGVQLVRAALAALLLASCATPYARPMAAANDPSNPDAPVAASPQLQLYGADGGTP